jgi:hypothetical protein
MSLGVVVPASIMTEAAHFRVTIRPYSHEMPALISSFSLSWLVLRPWAHPHR